MENNLHSSRQLIAEAYESLQGKVYGYLLYKVGREEEARDLTQDVFLHLMEYEQVLLPQTIRSFVFTITRNLLADYLRRYYKRQEVDAYLFDTLPTSSSETESVILAHDLQQCEHRAILSLSPQRRKVYELSRFEECSVKEISLTLGMAARTVESHLYASRQQVRDYLKQCI